MLRIIRLRVRLNRGERTGNRGERGEQGFSRLLAHASDGNVAAMGALGQCFMVGCGTQRNCAEGVR